MATQCQVYNFESLPLYLIEISIGQYLLPFERKRIKRLSKFYRNIFNTKTTILSLTKNASTQVTKFNISSFWNHLNYLQNGIFCKYFDPTEAKLSFTHQTFDMLSVSDYFTLKYLLIYYHDLKKHEHTITSLASENGHKLEWNNLFNMLPNVCIYPSVSTNHTVLKSFVFP